ncbi:hypothetical protein ACWGKX_06050, partial [Streptomyces tricolor]
SPPARRPAGRAPSRPRHPPAPPPPPRLRVSFPCPTCHQRIRVPVRGRVRARCGLCRTVLECDT